MKRRIFDFFKGFLLGLDSTIPGFSMGTLAIFLNIYERLINSFSNALKHPFKVIKDEFYIILGFAIGLIVNVFTVTYLLLYFPFETAMFFTGLVIVSIPLTYKNSIGKNKISYKEIISCIVLLLVLVFTTLLNSGNTRVVSLSPTFLLLLFLMGVIGISTMVIPGISGSLILLALGFYDPVLNIIKDVFKSFLTLNFDGFLTNIVCFIVFFIGAVIGLVFVSKGIKALLDKYYQITYAGIIGLLIASPFSIIYLTLKENVVNFSILTIVISVITFILGGLFAYLLDKMNKKNNL